MTPAANSFQHRRRHDRQSENRQLVSLFAGQQVFLGDFVDTSPDGIGAEFLEQPTVEAGDLVRVLVRSRLHDAIVRHIRRTDSAMTIIGLEIIDTLP